MAESFAVVVIGVGNELLNGRTANTNAQWLCGEIYALGGHARRVLTVPDDMKEIEAAVRETLEMRPVWIVTTGGLGPTYDDMTVSAVAKALDRELEENPQAKEMILRRLADYRKKGRVTSIEYTPARAKMAMLPKGGTPLSNPEGTAPGVLVKLGGVSVVCLPGVPSEMKAIFAEHLAPMMAKSRLRTITVDTEIRGIPEAALAPILAKLARELPSVYVKSHPRGFEGVSKVLVQLTGRGDAGVKEVERARAELTAFLESLKADYETNTVQDTQ